MMYWDTSALIKLFVEEPGTAQVTALFDRDPDVVISKMGFAEAHCALARRWREKSFKKRDYQLTVKRWNVLWKNYLVVELSDEVVYECERLVKEYPLRALDAIHLSSAIFFKKNTGLNLSFVCADLKLLEAAEAEGLGIIHPLEKPL